MPIVLHYLFSLETHRSVFTDPFKIQPSALYRLVRSLERSSPDLLSVLELVKMRKPLVSLDFCYAGDRECISLQDCISVCGMVAAYDSGTARANQVITV